MKNILISLLGIASLAFNKIAQSFPFAVKVPLALNDTVIHVPLGGNTWANPKSADEKALTNAGIVNWTNAKNSFETYIRVNRTGSLILKIHAKTSGKSHLQITIQDHKKELWIEGNSFNLYDAGEWLLNDTGYIKISMAGLEKSSQFYADIDEYIISGTAINSGTTFTRNNEGNFFLLGASWTVGASELPICRYYTGEMVLQ